MSLPRQRLSISEKGEQWGKDTIDHYEMLTYNSSSSNRTSNYNKRINYDLFNGKFNKADLEYVCNPLGISNSEFPATLQHYDVLSPAFNLLIGEEVKRPDNCIVVSDSPNDINRKQDSLKKSINSLLQQMLMQEVDPSTIDPTQPLPTPEQILKYERHNISDLIESQANKMLKFVKKDVNTKDVFKKGFKDVLCAGEEIYWCGVSNGQLLFRRCNPLNTHVILDGDSEYIDDAIAVVEVRMLTPSTILDEFGPELKKGDLDILEGIVKRKEGVGEHGRVENPTFSIGLDGGVYDTGIESTGMSYSSELIRVVRVEWKSFKKMYHVMYTDEEGQAQEQLVDETFKPKIFKEAYPDAVVEELWVNEAWEGIKIGTDIYVCVQPKENQRRRMDNPYYCKLGYTGLIYNSHNSQSISLIDRVKPYQYLYNIISYRLELCFARDQGKMFVMDVAQIPRSEGIDMERWLYYAKAMGIVLINSFEEGRKGAATGKFSTFNQFSQIDLSLANQIQQYISTLDFIRNQIAFISGVSPQRLGAISSQELVGNVERSVQQSALITEYLYDAHNEVKRRTYTALVECAKIAFKDGKKVQYVLDDMGIELLDIAELELENSEFNVHMTNATKDLAMLETVKQLAKEAIQYDKANFSTIIDALINDNPRDIMRGVQKAEADKLARDKATQDQQISVQQEQIKMQKQIHDELMADKQADRDLKQYEVDSTNETKLQVAQINVYSRQEELDQDGDGIPDPVELARLSMDERDLASKAFLERAKLDNDKQKHDKDLSIKDKELNMKKQIEDAKIEAIRVQNQSQEKMQMKDHELAKKEMAAKLELEKLKLKAARAKAAQAKKPKK